MAKCAKCVKLVSKKSPGLQCSKCSKWYHSGCVPITAEQLYMLGTTDAVDWKCKTCSAATKSKKRLSAILPGPDPDVDQEEDDASDMESNKAGPSLSGSLTLADLRREVRLAVRDELQKYLSFYSNKIDEYEKKVKDYDERVKDMENQICDVNNKCKNLNLKDDVMVAKYNMIEQKQVENKLEICGLKKEEGEKPEEIAKQISQKLSRDQGEIIQVYRKEGHAKRTAPPVLIVRLREECRDAWLQAAKDTQLTAKDVGREADDSRVYLREVLTPATAQLLWQAKTEIKEKGLAEYVWCKRGMVLVKKLPQGRVTTIRYSRDIEEWVAANQKPETGNTQDLHK